MIAHKAIQYGELMPEKLVAAVQQSGYPLELRQHAGYDHSYYCIASFVEEHNRQSLSA